MVIRISECNIRILLNSLTPFNINEKICVNMLVWKKNTKDTFGDTNIPLTSLPLDNQQTPKFHGDVITCKKIIRRARN